VRRLGCVEVLYRDHLAIRALLVQLGSEGPSTPEGVGILSSEWHSHVEHLEAMVADASPSARTVVRQVLDESGAVRRDITARLETMMSGRCTQAEIVRLAHELVPPLVEHGRAEAAVIATIAPAARADPVDWVFKTRDRTRL
jgi:hypothetical protein